MKLMNALERFRTAVKNSGSDEFDLDAFFADGMYGQMLANALTYYCYEDEMDPDLVELWRKTGKGLEKEMHYPEDRKRKYASYIPLSAKQNTGRKYPVIFCMHGGGCHAWEPESWGYVQLAAQEEIILLMPEFEESDHVMDILREARTLYPIDDSRIYTTGFSFGGGCASRIAVKFPETFAATVIGGHMYYGEDTDPAIIENAHKHRLPMMNITGNADFTYIVPYNRDQKNPPPKGLPEYIELGYTICEYTAQNKLSGMNMWRRIAGCKEVPIEESMDLLRFAPDPVELAIGTKFDRTEIRDVLGRQHLVGYAYDCDGANTLTCMTVLNGPHCVIPSMPVLGWAFMQRFRRNPETGELIILQP